MVIMGFSKPYGPSPQKPSDIHINSIKLRVLDLTGAARVDGSGSAHEGADGEAPAVEKKKQAEKDRYRV